MVTWDTQDVGQYTEYDNSELSYIHPALHSLLGDVNRKKVVDYGCGEGKFIKEVIKRGANAYGYDISQAIINEARRLISNNAELAAIDSGKIPLNACSTDAIVSSLVLMMCQNKEIINDIFREFYRVLRDKGILVFCITHPVFSDQNFTTYRNIFQKKREYLIEGQSYQFVLKKKDGTEITKESFRDYHYPLSTYLNLLAQNNFKIEKVIELEIPENEFPPYLIVKAIKI